MKKKILCMTILSLFLTSCAQKEDDVPEVYIVAEDFLEQSEDSSTFRSSGETAEASAGTLNAAGGTAEPPVETGGGSTSAADVFDENKHFQEYSALPAPISIPDISFIKKENGRYLFSLPDDQTTAENLYSRYCALLLADGFVLEEYEGNDIIKNGEESVAFMGAGYNAEHKHMIMMAFYTE